MTFADADCPLILCRRASSLVGLLLCWLFLSRWPLLSRPPSSCCLGRGARGLRVSLAVAASFLFCAAARSSFANAPFSLANAPFALALPSVRREKDDENERFLAQSFVIRHLFINFAPFFRNAHVKTLTIEQKYESEIPRTCSPQSHRGESRNTRAVGPRGPLPPQHQRARRLPFVRLL